MFKKILIANRGEIACRVAATARRMGVKTVAVYSDADAHAKHVAVCDEAVRIGGNAPADSYLQWQRIIDVAKATGAEAIHPGYGFLSENAHFSQACADAGLAFIGPRAESINAMGLKAESKRLMGKAGVPIVPGYQGEDQDPELLHREADRIGYPVLLKPSAGGGGKGMHEVYKTEDFMDVLASAKREASGAFGNDAMLIERLIQKPRHIEIQIFGDTQGGCVYMFERDCSTQRRHQKVLEEAPAPGMTPAMRKEMGEAAVAAARAVNYVGAGTVEFIVEQLGGYEHPEQMKFYFMEMNTRLQVEHGVTEAITGLDLVEWQLRVAAGEPLPCRQEDLRIHGHAIEARICAENPDNDFLPATGTLQVYRTPAHAGFRVAPVRMDDGFRAGDTISPYYDSLIAKVVTHGDTRDQAIGLLDAALAATQIVGLQTNVQFLRRAIETESFAKARLDTALIEREKEHLFRQDAVGAELAAAAATAYAVTTERGAEGSDPWSRHDGFRSHGVASRRIDYVYRDEPVVAKLRYQREGYQLRVGDAIGHPLQFMPVADAGVAAEHGLTLDLQLGSRRQVVTIYRRGAALHVFAPSGAAQITLVDPLERASATEAGGSLTAPMPGKVVSFAVQAGDKVSKGQPLAVMEAMKMEHTIAAPRDGVVAELLYAPGDQVPEGAELLHLQAQAAS